MTTRLDRPLTMIAFFGPVSIGTFDDGTIYVVGPNDAPVLIRNGAVMTLAEIKANGDLEFSYFTAAEREAWRK